jgi:hypothetical protein
VFTLTVIESAKVVQTIERIFIFDSLQVHILVLNVKILDENKTKIEWDSESITKT